MEVGIDQAVDIATETAEPNKDVATFATGAGITLIGKVSGRGLDAISEILLARLLGPSSFGLYAIGMTVLRIAGTIGTLGLQNGVIHFGARYWRKSPADLKSTLVYTLGFSLASGLILGGALFIFAPNIANQVFQKTDLALVFRLTAFAFPFAIGMWVASAATRISKRMKYSVIGEDLAQPAVNLLVIIALAIGGLTVGGVILAVVVSFGFAFGLLLYYLRYLFADAFASTYGKQFIFKDLLFFSIPSGLAGTFTLITGWVSRLFVGLYRPASEAGIYQAASQVSIIFVIILSSLNAIFAPMIADLYHRREMRRIEELYRISTKWGLYIILPVFLVICIIPKTFMVAIFGPIYLSGWVPLVILASMQVVNVGTGAVGFLLIMTGHQNHWFVISGLAMILTFILNPILVPKYGMVGTALATGISISGLYIAGLVETKRVLNIWPYDRRYIKGLIACGLTVLILLLLNRFIGLVPSILILLINLIISGGVFWLTLYILGLDPEDKEFILIVLNRIKKLRVNDEHR